MNAGNVEPEKPILAGACRVEMISEPDSPAVESVLVVGRSSCGVTHAKLDEVLHGDFTDYSAIADRLAGFDACFFCLGVSSVGMSEADYRRVNYDFTIAAAEALLERNPGLTFIYVSGTGTDSTRPRAAATSESAFGCRYFAGT